MIQGSKDRSISRSLVVGLMACGLVAGPTLAAWADESGNAALLREIAELKSRLSVLESKVASAPTAVAAPGVTGVAVPSGLPIQISGFVDTSYTYNLNAPQTNVNTLRVFDTRANSFMINNMDLVIEKPVSAESPVGFSGDLAFGLDSKVVGAVSTGLGATANELDVEQMYVEYLAPIGKGLDLKVGRFVTMHGAEVIKSRDDWNFSRSWLFGYAIPFTHTGIRAAYPWTDWLTTIVGVSNGWDVVNDNNKGKTIELCAALTPTKASSVGINYMLGPEQTGDNGNKRSLLDVVLGYQFTDALQAKLNFDYGWENQAAAVASAGHAKNASWTGLAGYLRYQLTPKFALAGRGEFLNDANGVRTALPAGINGITGTDVKLYDYTLTGEYKLNDHLITRLEYRHDQASEHIFRAHDLRQRSYQDTVAMEFIAPF